MTFLRSDAQGIAHDACINVGVDIAEISNDRWRALVDLAEELLLAVHKIGDGGPLLADTRAATEGSEGRRKNGALCAEVGHAGAGTGKCIHCGEPIGDSASSAPTRETGWIDEAVRVIQVLETDVFGQPIDRNVLRACITDAMRGLPPPPRDERPQTAEREG